MDVCRKRVRHVLPFRPFRPLNVQPRLQENDGFFLTPSPRAIELHQALPPNSNSPTATMESRSALLYKGSHLDERVERDMPMTTEDMRRRLGVAQVEALFDFIPVATLAAAAAAATLTAGLFSLGFVEPWIGAAWVCYIVACALGNLSLLYLYRRSRFAHDRWRVWALGFAAINFAMGIGFGWAPLGLTIGSRLDVEFLTLLVTLCVAAAAVTAFGPYLPAFVLFFLSATAPFTLASFFSSDSQLHRVSPFLMLIFIIGIGGLGVRANRAFERSVRLQVRTEELADDLERQRDIAESANLAKSKFLAAASHDLRQPVHALGLFVGALRPRFRSNAVRGAAAGRPDRGVDQRSPRQSLQRAFEHFAARRRRRHRGAPAVCAPGRCSMASAANTPTRPGLRASGSNGWIARRSSTQTRYWSNASCAISSRTRFATPSAGESSSAVGGGNTRSRAAGLGHGGRNPDR